MLAKGLISDDFLAFGQASADAVSLLVKDKASPPSDAIAPPTSDAVKLLAIAKPSAGAPGLLSTEAESGATTGGRDNATDKVDAASGLPVIGERPRNTDAVIAANAKPGDHITDTGIAGVTVRTGIALDNVASNSFFTNSDVNGILVGSAWGSGGSLTLSYSFPTASSQYGSSQGTGGGQYPDPAPFNGFQALTDAQKNVVRYAFFLISQYTGVAFTEITETNTTHATLRYAASSSPATSYGNFPAATINAGDTFYGNIRNQAPTKAGYAFDTIMHEIGHTLGLKHGQDANATYGTVGVAHLSSEWSIMTYQSYVGTASTSYTNVEGSGNQTYMIDDISALQYLYGANYNTNSYDSNYTWSPTTGEEFINGVGMGPSSTNKIYEAIWDGGGIDTYNLSNYTTNLTIDLEPGAWSTFSTTQLADLDKTNPGVHFAHGNIANANLYNSDLRSLIENATGGSGADSITGNQGNNVLSGNDGDDVLRGLTGNDSLVGGYGNDVLTGGPGADALNGGPGLDKFNQFTGDSLSATPDTISDFQEGYDNLDVRGIGGGYVYLAHSGNPAGSSSGTQTIAYYDYNTSAGYTEKVIATGDIEARDIVGDVGITIYVDGTSGKDYLYGGAGHDILQGEGDNDVLRGGGGADTLTGGAGSDTFNQYAGESLVATYDTITDFQHGLDNINLQGIPGGNVTLSHATSGQMSVQYDYNSSTGYTEDIQVTGDVEGADLVVNSTDTVYNVGTSAADYLYGSTGHDVLYGHEGNDVLRGGLGADAYTGGTGADTFNQYAGESLTATPDSITDFERGIDNINVVGIGGGSVKIDHIDATHSDVRYDLVSGTYTELIHVTGDVENPDIVADYGTVISNYGTGGDDALQGGTGADLLNGEGGNDYLGGGGGADTLDGSSGDDVLTGGAGADTLTGGDGADKFNQFAGDSLAASPDTITDFQEGVDNLDILGISGAYVYLGHGGGSTIAYYDYNPGQGYLEHVDATGDIEARDIVGDVGITIIDDGTDAADHLYGGAGNDILQGEGGDDTLRGGGGADILVGGDGADTFNQYAGESLVDSPDTITDFEHRIDNIDLLGVSPYFVYIGHIIGGTTSVYYDYVGATGYTELVQVTGDVEGDDVVVDSGTLVYNRGTSNGDSLFGGDGQDVLFGDDGADVLHGGTGADTLNGGTGSDSFNQSAGDSLTAAPDTINDFEHGIDNLSLAGVPGGTVKLTHLDATHTDVAYDLSSGVYTELIHVTGDVEAPDVVADAGTQFILTGYSGGDALVGGAANDQLNGGAGDDVLDGGPGDDKIDGGSAGNDTVTYVSATAAVTVDLRILTGQDTHGAGVDTLAHIDNVTGSNFDDSIIGDNYDNVLTGGIGADTLTGALGHDTIYGGAGDDTLLGGSDNDVIYGGADNDKLDGGHGDDILYGGVGDDTLDGSDGSDTASYDDATTGVAVDLRILTAQDTIGAGHDTLAHIDNLTGSDFADNLIGDNYNNVLDGGLGADTLTGAFGNDTIYGGAGNDTLLGGSDNDTIYGGVDSDTLNGGHGDDVLDGGADDDKIDGGDGSDTASYATATAGVSVDLRILTAQDTVGAGHDTLANIDNLTGSDFSDYLIGDNYSNVLSGGKAEDTVVGAGGNDVLHGGDGNDTVLGGSDNDTLYGDAGADKLDGGKGADILWGGADLDTFIFAASAEANGDQVMDFVSGEKLDLHLIDARTSTAPDDAFTFIGSVNFDGHAGELRTDYNAMTHIATVYGDTDGVNGADFSFTVHVAQALVTADFIL